MKAIKTSVVLAASLLALASTTGCGKIRERLAQKAAEKAMEGATGGEVTSDGKGGITVKDPKTGGTVAVGTSATLPDGWPSSVPVYPGGQIMMSMAAGDGKIVSFTSKDTPQQIATFYKSKLSGMKKDAEVSTGQGVVLTFKDSSNATVGITIGGSAGQTTVQMSYTPKK